MQPQTLPKPFKPITHLFIIGLILFFLCLSFVPAARSAAPAQALAALAAPSAACTQLASAKDMDAPTLVDFDDLKAGTAVGANYQPVHGVTFDDGSGESTLTVYASGGAVSAPNIAVNDPLPPNTSTGRSLSARFDLPVSQIGMYIGAGDGFQTTAVLTAYDQASVVLCSVTLSPVSQGLDSFIGLKSTAGAQIYALTLDYGKDDHVETIDNFSFSTYEPPAYCPLTWVGFPGSVNAGSTPAFTWQVENAGYYATQTYLVYDTVSHTASDTYAHYQAPAPNSGLGEFITRLPASTPGTLYVRPALAYQTSAGGPLLRCLGAQEVSVLVNAIPPTPTPPAGSLAGVVSAGKNTVLMGVVVQACREALCQSDTTDKFGVYSLPGLVPGGYTLSASPAGYAPFSSAVAVRSAQTTTADISLRLIPTPTAPPPTGGISGQVFNNVTLGAVSGAALELRPSLGNASAYIANTTADSGGNFSFSGVPAGSWLVLASQRDYYTWFQVYTVTPPGTASANIGLRERWHAPTPVPGAALDLRVVNVMAFQADQKWDNSLPLAANRPTALRGFVDLGSLNPADLRAPVEATLYAAGCLPDVGMPVGGVTPLPVSDWASSNSQRTAVLQNLGATLNFNLPQVCTQPGTRNFSLRLAPNSNNPERNLDNNTYNFSVTFTERRPLIVNVVRVSLRENWLCPGSAQAAPPPSAIWPAMRAVEWMYPTAVYLRDAGTDDYCASPRQENYYPGWGYINLGLSIRFAHFAIPSSPGYFLGGAVPMAYGLVDGAECVGGTCAGGQTPMLLDHHWVSSGLTTRSTTAPHEIGHARGLLHASNSHNEASGGSWVSWPYPHGAFSQFGAGETWGYSPFDTSPANPQGIVYAPIPSIPPPETSGYAHELMSYGNEPRWLSDVNWNNLFYSFRTPGSGDLDQHERAAAARAASVRAAAVRYLLVGGIRRDDGMIELTALRPLTDTAGVLAASVASALQAAQPLSYTLQLNAISGAVLSSRPFMPAFLEGDKQASFQLYLPFPPDVAAVTILTGTQVLTSHLYSSQAPLVSILSPLGSGVYTSSLTLAWAASDPDGEALSFDIEYSPDGGQTWQGLAAMLPDAAISYTINLSAVPGSENALFKLIASDGLNTTSAVTPAPLVIARKAPSVQITSLAEAQRFAAQALVPLEAALMDAEDLPPYASATFVWSSDRDGVIGLGQYTTTYGLSAGWHTITLTAADSDGMSAAASVRVFIGSALYLPALRR